MDDPTEEALEKIRKTAELLSPEDRDILRRAFRREAKEQANIEERLKIAKEFAAAMDDAADPPGEAEGGVKA